MRSKIKVRSREAEDRCEGVSLHPPSIASCSFSSFEGLVMASFSTNVVCRVEETPVQMLRKLFFFSMLMIMCPLATYFISKSFIFEGDCFLSVISIMHNVHCNLIAAFAIIYIMPSLSLPHRLFGV